jgi:hypothetical protein
MDSWSIALRPIGMLFELSMVAEMQVSQWLIKNELVFFIGINPWTDTKQHIKPKLRKKK